MKILDLTGGHGLVVDAGDDLDFERYREHGADDGLIHAPLGTDFPGYVLAALFTLVNDKEERGGENEQAKDKQGHDDQFDRDGASRGREWRWRGLIHVTWFSFASRTRRRWLSFKRLLGRDGDSACPVEGADQGQQPAFLDTGVDAAAVGGSTRSRLQLHEGG